MLLPVSVVEPQQPSRVESATVLPIAGRTAMNQTEAWMFYLALAGLVVIATAFLWG
jgi:hypothetical protein